MVKGHWRGHLSEREAEREGLLKRNVETGWDQDQVRMFVKNVRKAAGEGWNKFLGPELKEALIAREAVRTVLSMRDRDINVEDIRSLYSRMLKEAGLTDE